MNSNKNKIFFKLKPNPVRDNSTSTHYVTDWNVDGPVASTTQGGLTTRIGNGN